MDVQQRLRAFRGVQVGNRHVERLKEIKRFMDEALLREEEGSRRVCIPYLSDWFEEPSRFLSWWCRGGLVATSFGQGATIFNLINTSWHSTRSLDSTLELLVR